MAPSREFKVRMAEKGLSAQLKAEEVQLVCAARITVRATDHK